MVNDANSDIESMIQKCINNEMDVKQVASIVESGMRSLPAIAKLITQDMSIRKIEAVESVLKAVLLELFNKGLSGSEARELAEFQKRIGFVMKYKSYTIKAANPLGYSIFLQNAREGFSFQRHITHKTEVFHILEPLPGGFVFLCEYDEWTDCYEKDAFDNWLGGNPDARFDRFRFDAKPGDVFVIDKLNVVHTVVGCVLEEFATVSTDMVDRLHDQNAGKGIPERFCRKFATKKLMETNPPVSNRLVDIAGGKHIIKKLEAVGIKGGKRTSVDCAAIKLTWYTVDAEQSTDTFETGGDALSLYVTSGNGRVLIGDRNESANPDISSVSAQKGDLLMVAPGMHYQLINDGPEPFRISEHRLPYEIALIVE